MDVASECKLVLFQVPIAEQPVQTKAIILSSRNNVYMYCTYYVNGATLGNDATQGGSQQGDNGQEAQSREGGSFLISMCSNSPGKHQ